MSIIGTLELTYHVSCRWCNKDCSGSSLKKAYRQLLWHARMCEELPSEEAPSLLTTLKGQWELLWWKDPSQ